MLGLIAQTELVDVLRDGGPYSVLVAIIYLLLTEKLVPGTTARRWAAMERERAEEWRDIAQANALPIAEQAVQVARTRRA